LPARWLFLVRFGHPPLTDEYFSLEWVVFARRLTFARNCKSFAAGKWLKHIFLTVSQKKVAPFLRL
jgi:hypothetical protein